MKKNQKMEEKNENNPTRKIEIRNKEETENKRNKD